MDLSFLSWTLLGAWSDSILKAKCPMENELINEHPGIAESSKAQIIKIMHVIFYNPEHHAVLT